MAGNIEQIDKKILIGLDTDSNAIVLNLDTTDGFSISGEEYDLSDIIDEDEGERRQQEYFEDGEYKDFWKQAVQDDRTELGYDDWLDQVMTEEGWQETLGGDWTDLGNGYYANMGSCGQIDMGNKFDMHTLLVTQDELNAILKAWKDYHLYDLAIMNKKRGVLTNNEIEEINRVVEIFKKYPKFETEQLGTLAEDNGLI